MSKIQQLLENEVDNLDHVGDEFFYTKFKINKGNIKLTTNQIKEYYEKKHLRSVRKRNL